VYDRKYDERELRFEASGGLCNSALVMRDLETDSYWSIVTGDAIGGALEGTELREIPVSRKMQWRDWRRLHPDTLVLSVEGREDAAFDPYADYFTSEAGFGGVQASDRRLATMESIYAFDFGGVRYAVPFGAVQAGRVFEVEGRELFFHRPPGAEIFRSTAAFESGGKGFEKRDGDWFDLASGAIFDPESGTFRGGESSGPSRLTGFDTLWYIWSETHPQTRVLE
jgi:hypothetical protein